GRSETCVFAMGKYYSRRTHRIRAQGRSSRRESPCRKAQSCSAPRDRQESCGETVGSQKEEADLSRPFVRASAHHLNVANPVRFTNSCKLNLSEDTLTDARGSQRQTGTRGLGDVSPKNVLNALFRTTSHQWLVRQP